MRWGGIGTLRVSTRAGPSMLFAGANLGRPSSSICISVSSSAAGAGSGLGASEASSKSSSSAVCY